MEGCTQQLARQALRQAGAAAVSGCLSWVGRRAMGKNKDGNKMREKVRVRQNVFQHERNPRSRNTHAVVAMAQPSLVPRRPYHSAAYVPDVRRRLPGRGRPRDQSVRLGGSVGASCDQSHRSPAQSRPLHPHANPPYFSNSTRWSGCGRSVLRLGLPSIVHGRW